MGRVFFNTRLNIHALNAAYEVLDSDSGKVFMLSSTGGADRDWETKILFPFFKVFKINN